MISTNIHGVRHIALEGYILKGCGTILSAHMNTSEDKSVHFTMFCDENIDIDRLSIAVAAFNAALNGAPAEPAGEVSAPAGVQEPAAPEDDPYPF